jgi:hypothetical protein
MQQTAEHRRISDRDHTGAVRRANLTQHARRLTPIEVAQNWFRRGRDFAQRIHDTYPNFPEPAPDGLFLVSDVEAFFDWFHGVSGIGSVTPVREQAEAMRAARGH